MSKIAYLFAIVFLSLVFVADLIQYGFWSQMGPEVITMQSYLFWVTLISVTWLIAFSFVLRYFFLKGWKLVFLSAFVGWALIIVLSTFQYIRIVEVQMQPKAHDNAVLICYRLCITIVGVGIMIASKKHETALKWSGFLMALTSLLLLLLFISAMMGRSTPIENHITSTIHLLSTIVGLLLIWIFITEMRKQSFPTQISGLQKNTLLVTGTIAIVLIASVIGAASEVAKEIGWSKKWKTQGPALARSRSVLFEERTFVGPAGDTLRYFLMKPLNYDSAYRYPIVTCLHGGAIAKGENIEIPEPAPFLMDSLNRKKFPAFIFIPQVAAGHSWGWLPGVPGMDSLVFGALAALQLEFSLDIDRYYIAGGSGGGYGTWDYLSRRPHLFAAAISMCGSGNPATSASIAHIPVWAFHGEVDRNVSVSGSRNMIAAMRAAGGTPKYNEFRGVGHDVWPEVQRTPGVFEWLFAQKRKD
ncbi:carboxylesterase family protein [Flavitalea sp.]|nr:prolyl oligopeptidase family serine peptidase [Flavitalea sp.]